MKDNEICTECKYRNKSIMYKKCLGCASKISKPNFTPKKPKYQKATAIGKLR